MASRERDLESGHSLRLSTATTSTTPLPGDYGTMASDDTNNTRPSPQDTHTGMEAMPQPAVASAGSVQHAESSRSMPMSMPMPLPTRVPTPQSQRQPTINLSSDAPHDLEAGANTLRFGVDIPLPQPSHVASQLAQRFLPTATMSEINNLRSSFANYAQTAQQAASQLPSEQQLPNQQQNSSPPQPSQPFLQLQQPSNMTRRYTDTSAFATTQRQRSARATSGGSFEKTTYPFSEGRYPAISPRSRNFDLGSSSERQPESSGSGGGGPPSNGGGGSGQRLLRKGSNEKMPHIDPTVRERLKVTEEHAYRERMKYERKAKIYAQVYSFAIGFQVVLSALITALSAVTTGRSTSITTSVLGGMGTIVASVLARLRGTNEPELSVQRVKDLDAFIRRVEAFMRDKGEHSGKEYDKEVARFRLEFEYLLGNGDGERKMTTPSVRIG